MEQKEKDKAIRKIKDTFYELYPPKMLRDNCIFCVESFGYLQAIFHLFSSDIELVKWSVNGMGIMLDLAMKGEETDWNEDF